MDEKQRQEVLSLFKSMTEPSDGASSAPAGDGATRASLANTQIGGPTIVLCSRKLAQRVLTAMLRGKISKVG